MLTPVTTPLVMVAVPVALVPLGGELKVTVGAAVYPLPPLVMLTLVIAGVRLAVAAAPEPPVPALLKVTAGAVVYPVPRFVTVNELDTAPLPAREPMVWLKLFRANVPPTLRVIAEGVG